ncbi:iron ABC transporter permease [Halobacillus kuroshimensis]|uniref:Iron ABC transporter permease n=1 Tax=Halobacillus kuroshimensis TaxID=302481 RepID=A0ABS3DYR7_9BACI|nr:iron ABC transporter permease [Halobacillus kuroshimensis]MBN8236378.1 iron ABC transporter permease [Halobacillus kuroshimensis]
MQWINKWRGTASTKLAGLLIALFFAWFIVAFLIYPNVNLLKTTFIIDGSLSLEAVNKLVSSSRAVQSLINSFLLAVSLVMTVNIVGIFLVLVMNYFDIKGIRVLSLGYYTTLIYSGVVLVAGYKFLYGEQGFLTNLLAGIFPGFDTGWFTGYGAVLFVMTFAITSNHVIFLSNAIKKVDYQTIEAAKSMGASDFYIIRRVVLPVLKPTIFAVTILIFLIGLSATSAPLIVGGQDFQTINPMILTFAKSVTSRDIAAILSIVLGIATMVLLMFMQRMENNGNFISVSKVKSTIKKQKIENKWANALVHIAAYLLFVIYALPVVLIIIFSFTDTFSIENATLALDHFTLDNYLLLFTDFSAFRPYFISIAYSAASAFIVVMITLLVSRILQRHKNIYTQLLEYSMMIPWLLPSTLIALGLILTYDKPNSLLGNQVLTGSVWMLLVAYIIVQLPFTLRMLKAAFFTLDHSLEEAAKNLGASSMYTFRRILLPVILPSTLAVMVLNFNNMLADYDLTVFLFQPLLEPLGIVIKSSTDPQASTDAKALMLVYSVVLMVISSVALYFVYGRKSK